MKLIANIKETRVVYSNIDIPVYMYFTLFSPRIKRIGTLHISDLTWTWMATVNDGDKFQNVGHYDTVADALKAMENYLRMG